MPLAEDTKNMAEDIISSYETRLQSIGTIFGTTHEILQGVQDSLLDTKQEREKINGELRENLAKNESLRKKDFDNMTQGILVAQDEREKEVRNLLKSYLNEQREMARALGERLGRSKDSLDKGEAERVREFQVHIKEILAQQEKRRKEVTSKLEEFQKEQQEMAKRLKELLAKGNELRIKDLKSMLKEFEGQRKERLTRQEERRKEVRDLLGEFKEERTEASQNWRAMQNELANRKTLKSNPVKMPDRQTGKLVKKQKGGSKNGNSK